MILQPTAMLLVITYPVCFVCYHVTGVWINGTLIIMEKTYAMLAVTVVTLSYIIAAQMTLKRKEWEEEKTLYMNIDSIPSNSAAGQRSSTPVML